jgi:hypothetical protein
MNCQRVILVLLVSALGTAGVFAQGTTSRVAGMVVDASGAAVPNAKLTLANEATGARFETTSAANGAYLFEAVQTGSYSVTAEMQGFKRVTARRNLVTVGIPTTVNLQLEVGAVNEIIEVHESYDLVQTNTSANIGTTIEQRRIADMPIVGARGRNPLDLINYQPGVVVGANTGGGVHVNGARDRAFNITMDGIDSNESSAGGGNFSPLRANPDSLVEMQVITSNPSAEFGRNSGAQIAMVTRSGSNELHGTAFWFYRTPSLNANNWNSNLNGIPRPQLVQNIGGGSLGGPIVRNRTFYFGNVQALRFQATSPTSATVLTPTARQGLWRYVAGGRNLPAGVPNASVDMAGNVNPGVNIRTYNVVQNDPARLGLDPTMRAYLDAQPLPNRYDLGDGLNTAGFVFNAPASEQQRDNVIKIDHVFSPTNYVFVRAAWGYQNSPCDPVNGGQPRLPGAPCLVNTYRTPRNYAANWRTNPRPNITNELVVGWNQFYFGFPNPNQDLSRATLTGASFTIPDAFNFNNARTIKTLQFVDNMSYTTGAHTFKWGTNIRLQRHHDERASIGGLNLGTVANFSTAINVVSPEAFNLPADINRQFDLAPLQLGVNTLLGRVGAVTRAFVADVAADRFVQDIFRFEARYNEYDFYFQDTWRARRNLTLDLGLRWEIKGRPGNPRNNIFTPSLIPIAGAPPSTTMAWNRGQLYGNQIWNLAPSIGFAWDPFGKGKTSIRGNYRIAYDRVPSFLFSSFVFPTAPGNVAAVTNQAFGQHGGRLRDMPQIDTPAAAPSALRQPAPFSLNSMTAVDRELSVPTTHMWGLSVQQELPGRLLAEVNYIGRRAYNLLGAYDSNQIEFRRNGFLDEFNTVKAGGNSEMFNRLLERHPARPAALSGSAWARTQFAPQLANNNVALLANTIATTLARGTTDPLPVAAGLGAHFFLPFPQFAGGMNIVDSNDFSTYHALQVTVNRRFGNGLSFTSAYTWSKALDTRSFDPVFTTILEGNSQTAANTPPDIFNRRLTYGVSDFNRTHVWQNQFLYELPFGRGRKFASGAGAFVDRIIGGWQVAGMQRVTSGRPFTVFSGGNTFSNNVDTPINCSNCPRNLGHVAQDETGFKWFWTPGERGQFSQPMPGEFGNTGRNWFVGPWFGAFDATLMKRTPINERFTLELRADGTNVLNTPMFGAPTAVFTSVVFGRIGAGNIAAPRAVQLSAKVLF